jgi:hypothetical protein
VAIQNADNMKKKTLTEEIDRFKELCEKDPGMEQYMKDQTEKIMATSSFDEMKRSFPMMMDSLLGFNPIEPLRSVVRKKLTELYGKESNEQNKIEISNILKRIEGSFTPRNIPDGAYI